MIDQFTVKLSIQVIKTVVFELVSDKSVNQWHCHDDIDESDETEESRSRHWQSHLGYFIDNFFGRSISISLSSVLIKYSLI